MNACIGLIFLASHWLVYCKWGWALPLVSIASCRPSLRSGLIMCTLGGLSALASLQSHRLQQLPASLEGRTLSVQGTISHLPERFEHSTRVRLHLAATHSLNPPQPQTLSLYWVKPPPLIVGDIWQVQVKLKRPHGLSNPGTYQKETQFFTRHLAAEGTIILGTRLGHSSSYPLSRLRQGLIECLRQRLKSHTHSAIILALIMGDTQDLTSEEWQLLRVTGTAHLVAISGLHVSLIAGFCYGIASFLWRLSARACVIPACLIGAYASVLGALSYSALAGFALPTMRALIMLFAFNMNQILRTQFTGWQRYNMALIGVLVLEPRAALVPGFYLSFGAVALLLYSMGGRFGTQAAWQTLCQMQLKLFIGMLPLSLAVFNQYAPSGPLANLLSVPWLGFTILPAAMFGLLSLAFEPVSAICFYLADRALAIMNYYLEMVAVIDNQAPPALTPLTLALAALGMIILLSPAGVCRRSLGLVLGLPMWFWQGPLLPQAAFKVSIIDVGQGLSVLLQTQQHTLLYDTGPRSASGQDQVDTVLVPFFKRQALRRLDKIMISHADSDHSGGLDRLLRYYPALIISSEPERLSHPIRLCQAGLNWSWDGVTFKILHPSDLKKASSNARSCVLKVSNGKHSLLLPGDIEASTERRLVKTQGERLRADILVAPHHGSAGASHRDFIRAVAPQDVIFATGYRNRWHFPKAEVVQRYLAEGARIHNTAQSGLIEFIVSDSIDQLPDYRPNLAFEWID